MWDFRPRRETRYSCEPFNMQRFRMIKKFFVASIAVAIVVAGVAPYADPIIPPGKPKTLGQSGTFSRCLVVSTTSDPPTKGGCSGIPVVASDPPTRGGEA